MHAESFNMPPGVVSKESPLALIRRALVENTINNIGVPSGSEYVEEAKGRIPEDAAFYQHTVSEQTQLLAAGMRAASRYNRAVEDSPFHNPDARLQLITESAEDLHHFKHAGWSGRMALRLVFYHSPASLVSLRQRYIEEHGTIWTEGRLSKLIYAYPKEPETPIRLITDAFTYTRLSGNLAPTNGQLHEAVSIPQLQKGDLIIRPPQSEDFPELPIDNPEQALDYLFATVRGGQGTLRKNTSPSLSKYLKSVVQDARQRSALLGELETIEYTDFLDLLSWYADKTGYDAVMSDDFVKEIAIFYARNVLEIEELGASRNNALKMARYHRPSYYHEVVRKAHEYGITKTNFMGVFVSKAPIDAAEKLEQLQPLYAYFAETIPDVKEGTRLLLSSRALYQGDREQVLSDFKDAVKSARLIFGHLPESVIHSFCASHPNSFMERLDAYGSGD